jgi:hypothetical protein
MDMELSLLLDESIELELNVADLYMIFHNTFAEDADFWWQLALEEKNHGALLRSGKEYFAPIGRFPVDLLSATLQELKEANTNLVTLVKQYRASPPSRETAFNVALKIEQSAGEIHFQEFMEKETESNLAGLFQQLNRDDKDHETRLRSYMEDHAVRIIDAYSP